MKLAALKLGGAVLGALVLTTMTTGCGAAAPPKIPAVAATTTVSSALLDVSDARPRLDAWDHFEDSVRAKPVDKELPTDVGPVETWATAPGLDGDLAVNPYNPN